MKNSKRKLKIAILVCGILILFLLLILMALRIIYPKTEEETIVTPEAREEDVKEYVRNRGEKERMQVYLAEYIKHIERREYDQAYALLYEPFKENYFPNQELYVNYVEKNYSDLMMVEYNNIERQGNYYIMTVLITNLGMMETQKNQKFILYENGLNNYVLSFQVE